MNTALNLKILYCTVLYCTLTAYLPGNNEKIYRGFSVNISPSHINGKIK